MHDLDLWFRSHSTPALRPGHPTDGPSNHSRRAEGKQIGPTLEALVGVFIFLW